MPAKILDYRQYFRARSVVDRVSGCWLWQGATFNTGYGWMRYKGKPGVLAHRVCYEAYKGPVPEGLFVCHECDNPRCVNPEHLTAGTQAYNHGGMVTRGRSKPGEACARSKLTEEKVRAIRASAGPTVSLNELAIKFGTTFANIGYILRRDTWKHVT